MIAMIALLATVWPNVGPIEVFKKYWQPDLADEYAVHLAHLKPDAVELQRVEHQHHYARFEADGQEHQVACVGPADHHSFEDYDALGGVFASSGTETDPAAENEIFCSRFSSACLTLLRVAPQVQTGMLSVACAT